MEINSSADVEEDNSILDDFIEIEFSDTLLAQEAANTFISSFPAPTGRWKSYPAEETAKGSVLDIVCPTSETITPVVQMQKEWRPSNVSTIISPTTEEDTSRNSVVGQEFDLDGAVGQIKIYHPGMGAVVFDSLKKQASSCGSRDKWNVSGITSISTVGQESFSYSYSSSRERNTATVFREGDITGIVYGTQNVDTENLARQWALRWQKDLKKFCLNPDSTVDDATRQPLYSKYVGYREKAEVSLTDADKSFLSQNVTQKINEKYGIEYNNSANSTLFYDNSLANNVVDKPSLPTEPRLEPGEELEVLVPYQTFLPVSLPDTPPQPVYPTPPKSEPDMEVFYGPAEDAEGPGCGWALIGQEKPVIDKLSYDKEWDEARDKAQKKLENKYVDWSVSTWQYAIDYDEYVYDVAVWNTWVEEANEVIANAEWTKYDEDFLAYPTLLEEFETDLEIWRACANTVPLPPPTPIEPTPSPSPTPSEGEVLPEESLESPTGEPTIAPVAFLETLEERQEIRRQQILDQCGARPRKPREPQEPEMPRPVIAITPSTLNPSIPVEPIIPVVPNS